jgi:pimeloyl-ACP methyl ester carboxylesterase
LIEELGATPALLCGAGLGAIIALDLLIRTPQAVTGAVLVEPPLLGLLPEATELLSDDRSALESAAGAGPEGLADLYLSGGLGALASGAGRLPADLTAPARERPLSLFAEIGAAPGWPTPFARLAEILAPVEIVTSPSTPELLRAAASALDERLPSSELSELTAAGDLPPHLGAPAELSVLVADLSAERR